VAGVSVLGEGDRRDAGDVLGVDGGQAPVTEGVDDPTVLADTIGPLERIWT